MHHGRTECGKAHKIAAMGYRRHRKEVVLFHRAKNVATLYCILISPLSFASDLKITERSATRGAPTRINTTYISGRRTRIESRSVSGFQAWRGGPTVFAYGHRTATIYQCDARRLIFL